MILIKEEAKLDVLAAAAHYARIGKFYSDGFLEAVDKKIKDIELFPEANPIKIKNYRRALIKRFPYSIYYKTENNEAVVVAVLHNRSGLRDILNKI